MLRVRAHLIGLLGLAMVVAGPAVAAAQNTFIQGNITTQTAEPPGVQSQNFSQPAGASGVTITPPLNIARSTATAAVSASASGTSQLGRMTGRVNAASSVVNASANSSASGSVGGQWSDTATITGPAGSTVSVQVRMVVTHSLSATPPTTTESDCISRQSYLEAQFSVNAVSRPESAFLYFFDTETPCGARSNTPDEVAIIQVPAGTQLTLEGFLTVAANTAAGENGYGPVFSAAAAVDTSNTVVFYLDVLTAGASYTTVSGVSYRSGAVVPGAPSVLVTLSATSLRSPQSVVVGITAQNPAGQPEADLYAGVVLPNGSTVAFFTGPNAVGGVGVLSAPVSFVRMQAVLGGATVNVPNLIQGNIPPPAVLPPGTYYVFVALTRAGALADNQINPGDVLVVDVKALTILP